MLMGSYRHTVDVKGRMFMPARFRDELGDTFVVTKGLDRCLFVYSWDEFETLKAKVDALSFANKDARQFARFFFSGACECEADKQGRISVPQNLREYAHLEKDVTVIGVSSRAEIWNSSDWDEHNSYEDFDPDELAAKMESLGL